MAQYLFVAVKGGDGSPSNVTRSTRSHAIRAGLRKTKHGKRKRQQDLLMDLELPIDSIHPGSLDPFNSFPVPTNLQVDHLVKYLLSKFDSGDPTKAWFPYALQSAPMMHSTLVVAAVQWRADCPALERSIQVEGMRQKGEAMWVVGDCLAQSGALKDDDIVFIISTVSTLVLVEVFDGGFEAAKTHLKGVHHLLGSHGGRKSFKDQFILCKATDLADIQVAVALGHGLPFPPMHTNHPCLPPWTLRQAFDPPLDHSVVDDLHHAPIFIQLRQLLLAYQSSAISLDILRSLLNAVDCLILQHLYQEFIGVSESERRSRALVLAAQVFMYVTLRQVPPRSPVVLRLCDRLQSMVVVDEPSREIWLHHMEALLWIAFVELLGTGQSCPEGEWFLRLVQSTVQAAPAETSIENGTIGGILSAFLWDETRCRPLLTQVKSDDGSMSGPAAIGC